MMVVSAFFASWFALLMLLLRLFCLFICSSMVLSMSSSFWASTTFSSSNCLIVSLRDSLVSAISAFFCSSPLILSSRLLELRRCLLPSISKPLKLSCIGTSDSVRSSTNFWLVSADSFTAFILSLNSRIWDSFPVISESIWASLWVSSRRFRRFSSISLLDSSISESFSSIPFWIDCLRDVISLSLDSREVFSVILPTRSDLRSGRRVLPFSAASLLNSSKRALAAFLSATSSARFFSSSASSPFLSATWPPRFSIFDSSWES